MGVYLNDPGVSGLFREDYYLTYYVDKSDMIRELIPLVEQGKDSHNPLKGAAKGSRYVCITRPRRFGKTTMANMIAAFFQKGTDNHAEFDSLAIAAHPRYAAHLSKHNVIHIMFNELPDDAASYEAYIGRIKHLLLDDLITAYPDAAVRENDTVWDALKKVYSGYNSEKFIFILDEWDYVYHQDFFTDSNKEAFTKFLSNLLKDKTYVEMAYMTGILPIAKYSSGSELNMFFEYSMAEKAKYSEYFGFTDAEVDGFILSLRKKRRCHHHRAESRS